MNIMNKIHIMKANVRNYHQEVEQFITIQYIIVHIKNKYIILYKKKIYEDNIGKKIKCVHRYSLR